MSILIKGAKMPKDCPMCPLSHWNKLDEFTGCEVVNGKRFAVTNDKGYAQSNTRPSWCPLVEIPPHGDLVERDKLINRCKEFKDMQYEHGETWEAGIDTCINIIEFHVPTVIESEEQEHDCGKSEEKKE